MGDARHRRRVVGQLRVLADAMDHIGPKPVDTAIEPEAKHAVHGPHDVGLVPVQVGLACVEQVEVPLAGGLVEGPGGCGQIECRHPIVGWGSVRTGVAPDVPIAMPAPGARSRVGEPGVLVRGVVGYPVDDDPHPEGVGIVDQPVEVVQGPEGGVDVAVVTDVVPEVDHGRTVEGGQPQGIDPEPGEVGKMGPDAGQVPDPVAVGIGERPGVDLVEDRLFPPGSGGRRGRRSGRGTDRLVQVGRGHDDDDSNAPVGPAPATSPSPADGPLQFVSFHAEDPIGSTYLIAQ